MTFTVSETVSDETLNRIIQIESAGRLNVKAATSSALGLGQFLNATWLGVVKKHRQDLLEGRSQAQVLALRTDPQIAVELLARFTEDNQHAIGMNCTGGDLYLAHFLGVGDAKDLFRADPATPVAKLVSPAVINANKSIMLGKSAGQVRAWAAKRMHDVGDHGWVQKYYTPPAAVESLVEEPEAPPAAEPTAEDIPDPQDVPVVGPAVDHHRDPVPPVTPAPTPITPEAKESFLDWIKRKAKTITSWVGGGGGSIGLVSYLTDWRVAAVLVCGLIIAGIIAFGIYLLLRKR